MIYYLVSGNFHSNDSENDDVTITFKYEVDEDNFLKDVTVPVWKKIQENDDIMGAMSVAVHHKFVWSCPGECWAHASWSDDPDEADMTDGEHMFFTITSQKIVVGEVEDNSDHTIASHEDIDFETDIDDDAVSAIKEYFWDNFAPKFSAPNCDGRNYDCHYRGGGRCNVCRDIW